MGIKEKLRNLANNILSMIGDKAIILEEKIEICLKCGERFNEKIEAVVILPCIHVVHLRCVGEGICPEESCGTYAEEVIETVELEEIFEKESEETMVEEEIIENTEEERMEIEEEMVVKEPVGRNNFNKGRKRKREEPESGNKKQKRNDERREKLDQIIGKLKESVRTEWGEVELKELKEEKTFIESYCELERIREMDKETTRMVVKGYYNLGKRIVERIEEKDEKEAKGLLKEMTNEVIEKYQWNNLPKDEKKKKRKRIRDRKNRALKIHRLFQEIGEKRIRNVKPNMTNFFLDITWEEIEYIKEQMME
jgi:hypothetical protein